MKRVQIASDNVTVFNVSGLDGSSPSGSGTFMDVADGIVVAPGYTWNGNVGTPAFVYGPPLFYSSLDSRLQTVELNLPVMASTAPPGVSDTGAPGGATLEFSGKGHTHASKARKQRMLAVNAATYQWTYPVAFGTGVVPVCQAIVEDPANSASDSYNVQVVGAPTATQVTFRIIRQTSGLFGLLLGAIGFNPTPGTVNLHLLALEP